MDDIFTGGEVQEKEKGSIHPSFWKKQVQEAFGSDPYKLIIELIKNAADSYIRLKNSNKMQPPFNIFVEIDAPLKKSAPIIAVKDNAEGMTKQELHTALEYATITSTVDKSSLTSAEKGVGLKDALMAMILFGDKDRIITIKNNKISIAEKDKNFYTNWIKKDAPVSEEDRKKSGIPENGTIIYGTLPSFFKDKKFNTIAEKLSKHFLLRKLLQINDFKVHLIDKYKKQEKILTYKFPQIKSELIDEDFYIEYKNEKYKAHIKIYEAEKNLGGKKPFGETGLLIYSGLYSVLDLSLGNYENDPRFANIFGEVYLDIPNLEQKIRNGEEDPLVDNKRHGLITSNEFNLKLLQQINNYLEKIIQNKEEGETYTVNDNEILKYINKITKEISGSGSEYIPPINPKYFEFYPNYKEIKERSQETIDLIINAMEMKSDSVIKLKSTDPNLKISPQEIKLTSEGGLVRKVIEIYSEKLDLQTEIIAECENINHITNAKIVVVKNPIFYPLNGFSFVPNKISIVEHNNKTVILAIKKEAVTDDKIKLEATGPISCPGIITLPKKNMDERLIKGVLIEEIPIDAKKGEAGEEGTVKAKCGERSSELKINIIKEPSIGGLIRGVELSGDKTPNQRPARFNEDTGILVLYYNHPIFIEYVQKKLNFKDKTFRALASEILASETLRATITDGIKNHSPKFSLSHPSEDLTLDDYEYFFYQEYYKNAAKLQQAYMKLLSNKPLSKH